MIDQILARLENVKKQSNGWTAQCPAHDDRENSFGIGVGDDGRVLLRCFAGCETEVIVHALGLKMADLFPKASRRKTKKKKEGGYPPATRATLQPQAGNEDCTLANYSQKKKFPEDFLKQLGLQDYRYQKQPAIRIPYLGDDGTELAVRYRLDLEKSAQGDHRFRWKKGTKLHLYGLWLLDHARKTGYAIAVEGESDCHTLWHQGFPTVGIPGAASWKEEWAEELDGIPKIYFIIEPDNGGQAVLKWIAKSKIRDRAWLILNLGAKDPSALHISNPGGFQDSFQQALDAAVPWHQWAAAQMDSETKQAWEQCRELAEAPDILKRFSRDLKLHGVAGEKQAGKLLFLILITRFLKRLVSAALKGPSSPVRIMSSNTSWTLCLPKPVTN